MPSFLVTGYKTIELGIFSDKDPKVLAIKKAIRKDLLALFDQGVDWLVFQGNLGFEVWCLEVALELREEYGIQLACVFPFADHGQSWSEANQLTLARFKQVDYVNHSFATYQHPGQLAQHQDFLIKNTQGAYVFYDPEHETKLSYFLKKAKAADGYELRILDFERLNESLQED